MVFPLTPPCPPLTRGKRHRPCRVQPNNSFARYGETAPTVPRPTQQLVRQVRGNGTDRAASNPTTRSPGTGKRHRPCRVQPNNSFARYGETAPTVPRPTQQLIRQVRGNGTDRAASNPTTHSPGTGNGTDRAADTATPTSLMALPRDAATSFSATPHRLFTQGRYSRGPDPR